MKKRWNKNGSVLLIVVFVIALLSAIVAGIVQTSTEELMLLQNHQRSSQAMAIAEAGLNDAFSELRTDSSWTAGFSGKSFSTGSYDVSVSGTLPNLTVESTSTSNGYSSRVIAEITVSGSSPYIISINDFGINE